MSTFYLLKGPICHRQQEEKDEAKKKPLHDTVHQEQPLSVKNKNKHQNEQ